MASLNTYILMTNWSQTFSRCLRSVQQAVNAMLRVWQDTNTFAEFLITSFPSASKAWPVPEPFYIWSGGIYPCPHSLLRWAIYHGLDFLPQWSHSLIIISYIIMSTSGKEVPDYSSKSDVPNGFFSNKWFIHHLDVTSFNPQSGSMSRW